MTAAGPVAGRLRIAIVAASDFEFESRLRKTALSLAQDGHTVTIVALSGPSLAETETLADRVALVRVTLDRRIATGLRPLPRVVRTAILRAAGLAPEAVALPPARPGADRLRAVARRGLEILAALRRTGPWTDAVVGAAPDAEVVHAKALIALPVARAAARRTNGRTGRYVYDIADLHTESARLAKLPRVARAAIRRRERGLVRGAAGVLAATPSMAVDVARRFGVPEPVVLLNAPVAWRPETPGVIRSDRLATALGLEPPPGRPAIILYQGAFRVDQGIEELVAAGDAPELVASGAITVFLGFGHLETWLRAEAARRPGRMAVLPAVPEGELLEWTAGADVAFVGAPPRTANQRLTLPNKLFQSLMAGVPIVVGEGTEHCRLARADGVGLCCDVDTPETIAATVAGLLAMSDPEREALRAHCREVALERYSWERAATGLVELYRHIASGSATVER